MAIYRWASRLPGNAQECGEVLERIQQQGAGTITPQVVIENARDKESPLHRCFEWRDDVAAERFRENQARQVIRSIRVVYEIDGQKSEPMRVFVNFDATDETARSYMAVATVMADAELFERARQQLLREATAMTERYKQFVALRSIIEQMQESVLEVSHEPQSVSGSVEARS